MTTDVVLVGSGNITNRRHIPALASLGRTVRVTGVVGVDPGRVASTARAVRGIGKTKSRRVHEFTGDLVTTDVPDWIRGADLIVLGTPPRTHALLGTRLAKAAPGSTLLIEKPLVVSTADDAGAVYLFDGDSTSDVEDLVVATKIRLVSEARGRPSLGIRIATQLPDASNESGLGTDLANFYATLLLGKTIQSVRIVGNAGLAILGDPTGGVPEQNDLLTYGVSFARALTTAGEIVAPPTLGVLKPCPTSVPAGFTVPAPPAPHCTPICSSALRLVTTIWAAIWICGTATSRLSRISVLIRSRSRE